MGEKSRWRGGKSSSSAKSEPPTLRVPPAPVVSDPAEKAAKVTVYPDLFFTPSDEPDAAAATGTGEATEAAGAVETLDNVGAVEPDDRTLAEIDADLRAEANPDGVDQAGAIAANADDQLRAAGVPIVSGDDVEVISAVDQARVVSQSEADVEELRSRLADLQDKVSQLADRSAAAEQQARQAIAAAPEPLDPESEASLRTLSMARQTADAVIAEARAEAAEMIAEAERQRSDIIRRGREQAEAEFAAERHRVEKASGDWEAMRPEILSHLEELRSATAQFERGLSVFDESVAKGFAQLGGDSAPAGEPGSRVIDLSDNEVALRRARESFQRSAES